jgi:hypothetical protein
MIVSTLTKPLHREERRPAALVAIDPFLALSAIAGGFGLLTGGIDLPQEWLDDTPFNSYAIPGVVLLVVVGGVWIVATLALYARHPIAPMASITAGIVQLGWLLVQVALLGYISWMQPFYATVAVLATAVAWRWRTVLARHRG